MINSLIERQVENAVQDMFDDKTRRFMKRISRIAAKQGGESAIQNYKLLGKRVLITLGVIIIAVEATTSVVGFVISRRNEEQRIERVVRRVLAEERQEDEAGA